MRLIRACLATPASGILCLALFLCTVIASADVRPLYLYAEHHGNHVKLLWSIRQWRKGITGVSIWRRDMSNGRWTVIRKEIRPGVMMDRDWNAVDTSKAGQARLKKLLETRIASGKMKIVRPQTYYERAAKAKPAQFLGQSMVYQSDYDKALLSGFACIDRDVSADKVYEYGVSFVIDGRIAAKPEATSRAEVIRLNDRAFCTEVSVTQAGSGSLLLKWKSPFRIKGAGIVGYRVYRKRLAVAEDFQPIVKSTLGPANAKNQVGFWHWIDEGVDTTKAVIYAVAPVTRFQTELRRSIGVYMPPVAPAQVIFKELRADQPDMKTVKLVWTFRDGVAGLYDRLVLERRPQGDVTAQYTCVSAQIAPDTTSYVDHVDLKPDTEFDYRITALKNGQVVGEKTTWFSAADKRRPAAPIDFRARYVEKGDKQFIAVHFKPAPETPVAPESYKLSVFHGKEVWGLGEVDAAKVPKQGINAEFELPVSGGKDIEVQIKAIRNWTQSEPVRVKLHVPAQELPEVKVKSVTEGPFADQCVIHWEYENIPDLKGFRIYIDGKRVADEKTLGPKARQWTSGPLKFDTDIDIRIEAVSKYGKLSSYNSGKTYRISRPNRSEKNIRALEKAVEANDLKTAKRLLRMGTDPRDYAGRFGAVDTAALAGAKAMVELLLAYDGRSDGLNPLFKAILDNDVKAVKSLVSSKPRLVASRLCGNDGLTPLMYAIRLGRKQIIPILVAASKNKAVINAQTSVLE
ncbi:MAG: ankyrin repeat domain-containing protein, partial [Lentisphaerae bacterium]